MKIIFTARIKKNIWNVHKMFYTYHGCHGNIFPPKFGENENFSNQLPIFFKIIFKIRIKKNIRNVHKMFYTYYHGCHDNKNFPKCL